MLSPKLILFAALGVFAVAYVAVWAAAVRRARMGALPDGPGAPGAPGADTEQERRAPAGLLGIIGFVVNFFDTLGIGSFATTTSVFKLWRLVPDRLIPGTLNVGLAGPTVAQALIYISIVKVEMQTLILMIAASVAGAWLGAGIVAGWSRRKVQIGMGIALLAAAGLMLGTQLKWFPLGGDALGVTGNLLVIALVGNFALGALMTLGIGLYAPCMILVSLIGMNPTAAFPIMMGSCAFLMPVASIRFVRKQSYAPRASLWLTIAGIPAVLLAAWVVKSLPLGAVRWLVICVVVYTSVMMLRSARAERLGYATLVANARNAMATAPAISDPDAAAPPDGRETSPRPGRADAGAAG